nr:hypothetical protein [Amylibacter sp.]
MPVEQGETFLIPSGPAEYMHLCIVCTNNSGTPDIRLLVTITSIKEGKYHDPACLLNEGDHPFIKKPSFVSYRHCDQRSASKIRACIDNGTFISKAPLDANTLNRIIDGFQISEQTPPWALKMIEEV